MKKQDEPIEGKSKTKQGKGEKRSIKKVQRCEQEHRDRKRYQR